VIQVNAKLSCFIEIEEDDRAYIYVNITDGIFSITLEYANITDELNDFIEVNKHFNLYKDKGELISDLEKGHLQRVLGQPTDNKKLDLMSNLRMKMRHNNGTCDDSCILCNPNIGDDPFPDFIFNIRNIEPEGEV
jgi:hypothetical protein